MIDPLCCCIMFLVLWGSNNFPEWEEGRRRQYQHFWSMTFLFLLSFASFEGNLAHCFFSFTYNFLIAMVIAFRPQSQSLYKGERKQGAESLVSTCTQILSLSPCIQLIWCYSNSWKLRVKNEWCINLPPLLLHSDSSWKNVLIIVFSSGLVYTGAVSKNQQKQHKVLFL